MVKNQWFKHLIGGIYTEDAEFPGLDPFFAWNESSRRYVTEKEEFYIPNKWRGKPANSKQGSGEDIPEWQSLGYTALFQETVSEGTERYKMAMDAGIAPEQARLFLPAYALYVRWRWTTSLQGVMHFLKLRNESHAQWEIQEYARAVSKLTATVFPVSIGSLDG
jgi:thymidylate synthase (FAD)